MGSVLKWLLAGIGITVLAGALGLWLLLRASLPEADGSLELAGLGEAVSVSRDERGVAKVTATNREDLVFATGFLHAQERFFQMDTQRRSAAGEMAALAGSAALPMDRESRKWGLREQAGEILEAMPESHRERVAAYTEGVNAGLEALSVRPPEYLFLRASPEPWEAEDTVLVALAMGRYLNDEEAERDWVLHRLARSLPEELVRFLVPEREALDAPLESESDSGLPEPPGPETFATEDLDTEALTDWEDFMPSRVDPLGSNALAVGGDLTEDGRALVAGDMHLGLSLPNTWYRMQWQVSGEEELEAVGATLPGVPGIIVGSNGHIAWSFTNSQVHNATRVRLDESEDAPEHYRTPEGPRPLETREEHIEVDGGEFETVEVQRSHWGPVVDAGREQHVLVWSLDRPEGVNLGLLGLEDATDVEQAMEVANRSGMPPQNFIVGDDSGQVAWTIAGVLPQRQDWISPGETLPGTSDFGDTGEWLDPEDYPRVTRDEDGRLWSANARMTGGEGLAQLGDAGYALGARQGQIRDRLFEREEFDEDDMLAIQLDDEARMLAYWREVAREAISQSDPEDQGMAHFAELIENWEGHAAVDSVGYRVLRAYRREVSGRVLGPLVTPAVNEHPGLVLTGLRRLEAPVRALLEERPEHLLAPGFDHWEALLEDAARSVARDFSLEDPELAESDLEALQWGEWNRVQVAHPFSETMPWLSGLLDMPEYRLPGDSHMPRVQTPAFGASQRMSLRPGREEEAYFHMPGGQSGHFLSPWYDQGHEDWARGRPTPMLLTEELHRLELRPE